MFENETHDADEIYCVKMEDITPQCAKELRNIIGYVFQHFSEDTSIMTASLTKLRQFFIEQTKMNISLENIQSGFIGVTTVAMAFGIKEAYAISPNINDARICFVIGKPDYMQNGKNTSAKYFCAMRILNDCVYFTKIYTGYNKYFRNAVGTSLSNKVKMEGNNILDAKSSFTCKDLVEKTAKQIVNCAFNVDELYSKLIHLFGKAPTTSEHLLKLERCNSIPYVKRIDTVMIDKTINIVKERFGVCENAKRATFRKDHHAIPLLKRQ